MIFQSLFWESRSTHETFHIMCIFSLRYTVVYLVRFQYFQYQNKTMRSMISLSILLIIAYFWRELSKWLRRFTNYANYARIGCSFKHFGIIKYVSQSSFVLLFDGIVDHHWLNFLSITLCLIYTLLLINCYENRPDDIWYRAYLQIIDFRGRRQN